MSFKDYLDNSVLEEALSSFKYTVKIRNIKDLLNHISNWKNDKYSPELEHTKAISIYDASDALVGNIKDKGKAFELDNKLAKDKTFKTYIEKGL